MRHADIDRTCLDELQDNVWLGVHGSMTVVEGMMDLGAEFGCINDYFPVHFAEIARRSEEFAEGTSTFQLHSFQV